MFKKLAKFRPFETWHIAPGATAVHSNDNLPGFRHPAGSQRRRPNQTLACHWVLIAGRLECHWDIEAPDGAPIDDFRPQPKAASHAFGSPPAQQRADLVTLRLAG